MNRLLLNLGRAFWYAFVAFLVVSAGFLTAARLLLPLAHEHTHAIEQLLSETLHTPVRVGRLDAQWHRFGPKLTVEDVRVFDASGQQQIARFEQARLDFDVWSFLRHRHLGLNGVAVAGVHVVVERTEDGIVRLAGLGTGSTEFDSRIVEQWLFGQLQWEIERGALEWRDAMRGGRTLLLTDVDLRLRNDGERHRVQGSVQLPGELGERIEFGADFDGDPLQFASWTGRLYVAGADIDLASISQEWRSPLIANVTGGRSDFKLWGRFERGLQQVVGEVKLRDLGLVRADHGDDGAVHATLETRLLLQRRERSWSLQLDALDIVRAGEHWPQSRARLIVAESDDGGRPAIDAEFSFIRLQDIAALATQLPQLDDESRALVAQAQPHGDARDVIFRYRPGTLSARYRLRADAVGLAMTPSGALPGFSGVSGLVYANERGGSINLLSQATVLQLPHLFRGPLPLGNVRGVVDWSLDPDSGAWRVSTDQLDVDGIDGEVHATLSLAAPDRHTAPHLDLVASFRNGNGSQISRYLPVSVMSDRVVEWLDHSVREGRVTSGGMVMHGRLDQLPFDNVAGRFEVRGHVVDGVLDYLAGWPRIEDIDAELVFSGRSMEVHGNKGRIYNSALSNVFTTIPDMRSEYAILTVSGDVQGDTADQLAYLRGAPPLNELVGRNVADLKVEGRSDLHLDLAIPLGRALPDHEVKVSAQAKLDNNTLTLGAFDRLLDQVSGALIIDNDGIRGDRVRARVLGQPATLDIGTVNAPGGALVQIKSQGVLNPAALIARYVPQWSERFAGEGRWLANLKLPLRQDGGAKKLHVEALLDAVQVRLPEPLAKPAGEALFVEVNADLSGSGQKLFVQYGNRVGVAMQLVEEGADVRVTRGEIHFGEGRARLPKQAGVRVSGNVEQLSLDEWRTDAAVEGWLRPAGDTSRGARSRAPRLEDIDLHGNRLTLFGQALRDAHVKVTRGAKEWRATVLSSELSGQLRVPFDLAQAPVVMNLERWRYIPTEGANRSTVDPRELPALEITSDQFLYGDVDFGRLQFKAAKFAFGWRVDQLEMNAPLTMVNGSGVWTYDGKQHQSRFDLDVISQNVGKTMSTFGYADSIADGTGRINLRAAWAAPMPDVEPELIDGKLTMEFKKGRLLEVNPGAGRLFALLSIQALPRRLSLDFSDLFAKGFAFDEIRGDFRLERGEAYTSNLAMNGPAGKIRAAGRVGLNDRDYDQLVKVIPDLTGSVPTLTGIIAASPQVGIVTYVLGKIFQSQIDEATGVEYTITGSWEHPTIERVAAAPTQLVPAN